MKFAIKAITLAVALVGSGNAVSAITPSGTPGTGSEGVLSIIDGTRQISYTRDLGILQTQFTNAIAEVAGFSRTWAPDALLTSFLGGAGAGLPSLQFSVAFGRAELSRLAVTTSLSTAPDPTPLASVTRGNVNNAATFIDQYLGAANTLGTHPGAFAVNGSNTAVPADGVAYVDNAGNGGRFSDRIFGYLSAPGHSITGAIGTSMNFLFLQGAVGSVAAATYNFYDNANGFSKFTLGTDGTLTFLSPDAVVIDPGPGPSVIPVPGALVLMLSGLGAFGFFGRRKSRAA